ncbi:MAG: hypothetical protein ABI140_05720 [Jatrophihabitantaceae bacterium]
MIKGLTVVMMVRNEQGRVGRALASARPVAESWLVLDTGSTDNTMKEVAAATQAWPGLLLQRPWVDFGHNRTELLQLGAQQGAKWLLMLDADHELADHTELAKLLATTDADVLQLPYTSSPTQWVSRIVRCDTGLPWSYGSSGGVHEYLLCTAPYRRLRVDAPRILDHADGASRAVKWQRDRIALLNEVDRRPDDVRSWFYLGETYRAEMAFSQAIDAYLHCARLCDGEQAYVARLYAGCLMHSLRREDEAVEVLTEANTQRPQRREALLELCSIHNQGGQPHLVVQLLGDGDLHRPIPPADTEGIYQPAYSTDMDKQRQDAMTALAQRAGTR